MTLSTFMRRTLLALTALPLLAGSTFANPAPTAATAMSQMLRAYEYVPASRAELLQVFPDALERLSQVALDTTQPPLERARAMSFLSFFANPDISAKEAQQVRQIFDRLIQVQPQDSDIERELRAEALYALGRTFGPRADKATVLLLERHALQGDALMADSAVRALRWVNNPEADSALQRLKVKAKPELKRLVEKTHERRMKRLQAETTQR